MKKGYLRELHGKKKAAYIWDYYKWLILGIGIGGLLLVFMILNFVRENNTNYLMEVTLVDADSLAVEAEGRFETFLRENGYPDDTQIAVDSSLKVDDQETAGPATAAALQVLAAEFSSSQVDLFVSQKELFLKEMRNHAYSDLTSWLPESFIDSHRESLIYQEIDGVKEPVGVVLDQDSYLFWNRIYQTDQNIVAGIGSRSQSEEAAAKLLMYLADTDDDRKQNISE